MLIASTVVDVVQTVALVAATLVAVASLVWTTRDRRASIRRARLERVQEGVLDLVEAVTYAGEVQGHGSRVLVAQARLRAAYTIAKTPREPLGQTELLLRTPSVNTEAQAEGALVELAETIDAVG